MTLTFSTTATNGAYGVAVGLSTLSNGSYARTVNGVRTPFPHAGMLLQTSTKPQSAPTITVPPAALYSAEALD